MHACLPLCLRTVVSGCGSRCSPCTALSPACAAAYPPSERNCRSGRHTCTVPHSARRVDSNTTECSAAVGKPWDPLKPTLCHVRAQRHTSNPACPPARPLARPPASMLARAKPSPGPPLFNTASIAVSLCLAPFPARFPLSNLLVVPMSCIDRLMRTSWVCVTPRMACATPLEQIGQA